MSDDSRKKILARRASFIAAALASVACGKDPAQKPEPCLSVPLNYHPDDAAVPESPPPPQPCLSPMPPPEPDAGSPLVPPPQPCLSIRQAPRDAGPTPAPHPCLTPKRPTDP